MVLAPIFRVAALLDGRRVLHTPHLFEIDVKGNIRSNVVGPIEASETSAVAPIVVLVDGLNAGAVAAAVPRCHGNLISVQEVASRAETGQR